MKFCCTPIMGEFILAKSMTIDLKLWKKKLIYRFSFSLVHINHIQQSNNGWYMIMYVAEST